MNCPIYDKEWTEQEIKEHLAKDRGGCDEVKDDTRRD